MFTFLLYPGMPAHNNDTEREIRDAIIPQRNIRHKLTTIQGREVFSTNLTFVRTAHKQKISSARALLEHILDSDWSFENVKDTPYSLTNSDGSRYSIFEGLDPPYTVRQDQAAGVASA